MPFEAAGRTDVGLRREHNEDALLVLPEFGLAVVCDGLGGHQAGEVASAMAVDTVRLFFERTRDPQATWPFPYDESRDEATNLLEALHVGTQGFSPRTRVERDLIHFGEREAALALGLVRDDVRHEVRVKLASGTAKSAELEAARQSRARRNRHGRHR